MYAGQKIALGKIAHTYSQKRRPAAGSRTTRRRSRWRTERHPRRLRWCRSMRHARCRH